MSSNLLANLNKIHTTELGVERLRKNLALADTDVVAWCKDRIKTANSIIKQGKNWYVYTENTIITVNASSFTIITAHIAKEQLTTIQATRFHSQQ
ncbi:MAG: DUF3781 domain-containing protein [Oscillospiraceae bacterium]|nr:DUF3781 domain-containing protein [Oscillospiraceae bacterium]